MHADRASGSDDTQPHLILPPGKHLAVTWGIPDEYGGMTAAMLRRSRQLARDAQVDVDIMTFDERPDIAGIEQRLRENGALVDGVRLRGIYAYFRDAERRAADVPHRVASPERAPDEEEHGSDGAVLRWRRKGDVVRTEHVRLDGTAAVVDERRAGRKRRITAFDRSGRTTGQWTSATAFRFAWLDEHIGDEAATVIVDSKTAARSMQHYRRRSVSLIHAVHGAHHEGMRRLAPARQTIFEALPLWDAVVFLTERQREAVAELLGAPGNLAVVPNSIDIPDRAPRVPSDRLHGVIVSRMTKIKRLEHALAVIARVRELGVPVTASIVGDGPERASLEAEASRLGLSDAVEFTGFVPHAAELMHDGAWTLLTSTSEGESLMLLEAMAAGCIPVAYDIRYGPSELIEDGHSGRLVPDGDVEAAARALVDLCRADDQALAAMQQRARSTAEKFDDDTIARRWAAVMRDAAERRSWRGRVDEAAITNTHVWLRGGRHVVTAIVRGRLSGQLRARLVDADGEVVTAPMRRWGPLRVARLALEDSRRLSRGPVRAGFLVSNGEVTAGVDGGVRHPDAASVARRALGRARRWMNRRRARTSRSGR